MAAEPLAPARALGEAGGMSLLGHLDELRKRLLRTALGVAVAFGLCAWKADELFRWCAAPYEAVVHEPLAVLAIGEAFLVKMRVAFLASLFVSAPFTLWQVWCFVSPGLYPRERKLAVPFVAATSFFFLAGGAFAYWVGMPAILRFLLIDAAAEFQKSVRAESYMTSLEHVMLGMGLVFETPVLAAFLARLGLITPGFLLRKARHAVLLIAVAAAVITPSGDLPTMLVFAAPMLALYGIGIVVAWAFSRRSPGRLPGAGAT